MTSKKVMLSESQWQGWLVTLAVIGAMLAGCQLDPPVVEPKAFPSPYPAPKVWAVAPFRNETGTTQADGTAMADRLTQHLQQVEGVTALPVNRVLQAMDATGITVIDSVDKVQQLLHTLGADGLLVGTLTAWDPYDPPKIGAILQLYSREFSASHVDSRRLSRAAGAGELPGLMTHRQPVTQVNHYFDAADGATLNYLRHYATGRVPADSAAGWRRYLLSMNLYAEFVSHELMRRLFDAEWKRLAPAREPASVPSPN